MHGSSNSSSPLTSLSHFRSWSSIVSYFVLSSILSHPFPGSVMEWRGGGVAAHWGSVVRPRQCMDRPTPPHPSPPSPNSGHGPQSCPTSCRPLFSLSSILSLPFPGPVVVSRGGGVAAHWGAVVRPGRCVDRPLLLSPHLLVPIQVLVLDRSFVISFICLHSSSRSPLYCRVLTLFNSFLPRADTFVLTPFNGFLPRADTCPDPL